MRGIQNKLIIAGLWRLIARSFRLRDILRRKAKMPHILMFHQVHEKENDCKQGDFSVSINRFEDILSWHVRHGYRFADISEILNGKQEGRPCYITFDDGYEDVLCVLPVLRKFHAPFCIYIITNKIGREGYLNARQIQQLAKDPLCTIGSHTCTHPYTRYLSEAELKKELDSSKAALQRVLPEKTIIHFAFPYGTILACSFFDRKYVKEAGYLTAMTTNQHSISKFFLNRYALPRFDASRKDLLEII